MCSSSVTKKNINHHVHDQQQQQSQVEANIFVNNIQKSDFTNFTGTNPIHYDKCRMVLLEKYD
jgi:hypothetical protein